MDRCFISNGYLALSHMKGLSLSVEGTGKEAFMACLKPLSEHLPSGTEETLPNFALSPSQIHYWSVVFLFETSCLDFNWKMVCRMYGAAG
jgi:hypothetical protein